ncbi:50S ribosomal protein L11 methyltransferase [Breoghania sp. L-A4]|uniref:class I SAM-dependent methyltransferase n=1 Tax=Breoghania sp. L-A4 TaxID=2304600 RepID=UPI003204A356
MPLWQRSTEDLDAIGIAHLPFWASAWVGGQALARFVLDNPEAVRGKRVLDFATGSGIVGIAAALAGAARVVANDIDPMALEAAGLNAAANGVTLEMQQGDITGAPATGYDVILCGDVFYEKPMAEAIFDWLERSRRHAGEVLIGDPGRSYLPYERLEKLATYEMPATQPLEDTDTLHTTVWRFTRDAVQT